MMISPDAYYNAYLKDRSIDEIKSSIRSLKREIGHLKNVMEHPDYMPTSKPDESTQLWCARMYLERAIQALKEAGETYSLSQTEIKSKKFNDNIPFITKIKFVIGGFAQGHNRYHLTISDDKIEKEFKKIPDDVIETVPFLIDKDEFLEQFSKLNIGEWRANYTTHKYGFLIDDGTQWALDIYYSNGARKKEFWHL